ncbi:hypothetical protein CYMTET_42626 [Cymbomonas tetramitiformis]|uniref:Uncharacterized protein n=1 Tax=Cymbomonas tetramitiformis TaxID=36881 RepID=A0AAE0C3W7_9CHLO|nr:hypothetical protein CYMTET_42626 [Cymbomonas tetramitiformis]
MPPVQCTVRRCLRLLSKKKKKKKTKKKIRKGRLLDRLLRRWDTGARGELDYIDVLGVPVGKVEAVSAEMMKNAEKMCHFAHLEQAWARAGPRVPASLLCQPEAGVLAVGWASVPTRGWGSGRGMGLNKAARVSGAARAVRPGLVGLCKSGRTCGSSFRR